MMPSEVAMDIRVYPAVYIEVEMEVPREPQYRSREEWMAFARSPVAWLVAHGPDPYQRMLDRWALEELESLLRRHDAFVETSQRTLVVLKDRVEMLVLPSGYAELHFLCREVRLLPFVGLPRDCQVTLQAEDLYRTGRTNGGRWVLAFSDFRLVVDVPAR